MTAVLQISITVTDSGDVGLQAVGRTDPMLIVGSLELAKARFVSTILSPEERRVMPISTMPVAPRPNGNGGQ